MGGSLDEWGPIGVRLLELLERWLAEPDAAVLDAWRARDALTGERIAWQGGTGVAEGIDDGGALLVRRDDGTLRRLDAGEVHLLATG